MKKFLLLFVVGLTTLMANGQTLQISGKVLASDDNSPLPGVSVTLKGSTRGTTTDVEGNYKIEAPKGSSLVYSFVGMISQTLVVGNKTVINVSLASDAAQLSEVVVTALGVKREERSLGYAVQQIDGEGLAQVKEANVVNSLQGKIAGVQITGSPGNIGGSSRIVIRGVNSIGGNNQPLFVVDGTPIDNSNYNSTNTQSGDGGTDFGNAAQDINPDDIESISVLKGPSAAALYGSRAANGVILITTKKGTKKKGLGVQINSSTQFNNILIMPDYQNTYGGGYKQSFDQYNGEPVVNYAADESWGPRMDGQLVRQWYSWYPDDEDFGKMTPFSPNPNNIADFYETGRTLNNNISLSGASDNTNFRLSYTNLQQKGTIPNSKIDRNTVNFSGSAKLSDKLTANIVGNFVKSNGFGRPSTGYGNEQGNVVTSFNQWFQRQIDMDKLSNYKTADGKDRTWNIKSPTNLDPLYWENPYWVLFESPTVDERSRVFGNMNLSYQFTPELSLTGFVRTDFYTDRREQRIASGSIPQDWYREDLRTQSETNYELLAQYSKTFGDISVSALAGGNIRYERYFRNSSETAGGLNVPNYFNIAASVDRPSVTDYFQEKQVNSVYGSATIGYKDIVYFDASLRNDISSTLPVANNSYLYPALGGSFVFSSLMDNNNLLSFGKLRASWAKVGNDTDPYQLRNNYGSANPVGSNPAFYVPNTLNNSTLVPETTTSYEIGLDMRFLKGRAGFDFTYYDNATTDQILDIAVSGGSGFTRAFINAGKVTNKGVELMLTATPIKTSQFSWDVSINFARNRNKVVELAPGLDNYLIASWGPSVNARVGESYGTIVAEKIKLDDQGRKLVDENGYYVIERNQVVGSVLADFTGGFINTFAYKGFSLNAVIDYQKGGNIYSVTNRYGSYSGLLSNTVGLNDRGVEQREPVADGGGIRAEGVTESGAENTVYLEAVDYWGTLRNYRDEFVYDASFIKLREVSLGYSIPSSILKKTPFTNARISLVGRNLAILFKNIPNVDPEAALGSGNIQGFENGQHPSFNSTGFNLNFGF
ncbi:TonB-linked outer membrane protein, SusC/RagA family [Spirosomataceae bacterium TFI 002]|nr:TonB-linked outer membrane protein, SusC/RagA family [Spirosomataceae bacterium TFI 002]